MVGLRRLTKRQALARLAFSAALDNPKIVKSLPYPTTAPGENANPPPFQIVTKRDNVPDIFFGKLQAS